MVKIILRKPSEDTKSWFFEELPKFDKTPGSMYIDGGLFKKLTLVKKLIRKDWDAVYVVDGEVGAGKSVFTQQICYFVSDGDFTLDEVTFKPKEFRDQVLKSPKYNGIMFDEAFRGMSSRGTLTGINKMLMSLMQEIRQRNLFIFIVLPSIWDLDSHIKLNRCRGLFHIHTDENKDRGYWKFYSNREDQIGNSRFKIFFGDPRNKYRYPPWHNGLGKYVPFSPFDEKEYDAKKKKSLGDYSYEENTKSFNEEKYRKLFEKSLIHNVEQNGDSFVKLGKVYDMLPNTLNKAYHKLKSLKKSGFGNEEGTQDSINLQKVHKNSDSVWNNN